jgi:hypothetical protein
MSTARRHDMNEITKLAHDARTWNKIEVKGSMPALYRFG